MSGPRFSAAYWLETGDHPARAAEIIAGEQSSGTFVALPGETPALKARSGARVEALTVLDQSATPSLPFARESAVYTRAKLTLSWPLENIGPSLPNLLSTIAGNLFELSQVSGLRLLDLHLPAEFARAYPGPAFGVEGTRRWAGVPQGPLIGTIIKPSVGLSAEETALQVRALIAGGIDFIKDDELQANGPRCPFEDRVRAVMHEVHAGAERLGRKAMVAFNITGEIDEMQARHDLVARLGGSCVMVCVQSVGLAGVTALRRHATLPIHAHRAGWGYLSRAPGLGWDFKPWQKLWRLAGVDHLHVNGLGNKFSEPDHVVVDAALATQVPLFADQPMRVLPVFSSAQTGLQAAETVRLMGSGDFLVTAGGGIIGHPSGIESGVLALREAYAAALEGQDIQAFARTRPALAQALAFWGA